jgi:hypothetical protein
MQARQPGRGDAREGAASARRPNSAKQNQARPNKSKQYCLDLLGFISPNRDFSTSYGEKNKKNPLSFPFAAGRLAPPGFDAASRKLIAWILLFAKQLYMFLILAAKTGDSATQKKATPAQSAAPPSH